jgi:hypothetical protein
MNNNKLLMTLTSCFTLVATVGLDGLIFSFEESSEETALAGTLW